MTPRRFTVSVEVRPQEVDAEGTVWHGHYLAYFESARNALLAAAGLSPAEAVASGFGIPVRTAGLVLKQPARQGDTLLVAVTLQPPEPAKLAFAYEARRLPLGELVATGTTEQVILNASGEILLWFPPRLKKLVERILDHQRGETDLN